MCLCWREITKKKMINHIVDKILFYAKCPKVSHGIFTICIYLNVNMLEMCGLHVEECLDGAGTGE